MVGNGPSPAMLPDIYILTMGRKDKQLTYQTLPDFLKERVIFVVRDFEAEHFKSTYPNRVETCPDWVQTESLTRKFIQQLAGAGYHWVMDDDLMNIWYRPFNPESAEPWKKHPMDWHLLVKQSWEAINSGIDVLTFTTTGRIPSAKRHPMKEGLCGIQWFILNGARTKDLVWDALTVCGDYYAMFDAITKGKRTARWECFPVQFAPPSTTTGCGTYRTNEIEAECQRALMAKWPKYVKPSRACKNYGTQNKINVYFVKAYKDHAHLR
jgi:hypothetical protein